MTLTPDLTSDDLPDIAALLERNSDHRVVVEILPSVPPFTRSLIWFSRDYAAHSITTAADKDDNDIPEIVVALSRVTDGRILIESSNATGATGKSHVWFAPGHYLNSVVSLGDADSDGVPDVGVTSTRYSDGRVVLETKNIFGGTNPRSRWFPAGFRFLSNETNADENANGFISSAFVRESDHRFVTFQKDAMGAPGTGIAWFSPDPAVPANFRPTADAGMDLDAFCEDEEITLAGRATDRDGTVVVSNQWQQVAGDPVNVVSEIGALITLSIPIVATETTSVFEFSVTDNEGLSNADRISLTVQPCADPVAVNDDRLMNAQSTVVPPGPQQLSIDVLSNDTGDPDALPLTIDSFSQPGGGSVVQNGNNLVYNPDLGFLGVDSFTYVAADSNPMGSRTSNVATVQVTVNPTTNFSPTVQNAFINGNCMGCHAAFLIWTDYATTVARTTDPDNARASRILAYPRMAGHGGASPQAQWTEANANYRVVLRWIEEGCRSAPGMPAGC